jgi:formylglycine-generating enzyme required for sulfatase activity
MRSITHCLLTWNAVFFIALFFEGCAGAISGENHSGLTHFQDCSDCSEMITLPDGVYTMGATKAEFEGNDQDRFLYINETPRHLVHVKSFSLGRYAVTKAQFSVFARETGFIGSGCRIFNGHEWVFDNRANWQNPGFTQTPTDPVVCVSWNDAQLFINWINHKNNRKEFHKYRLPTEEEFEYAERAGTITSRYWGDTSANQCLYENARDIAARSLDSTAQTVNCNDRYVETAPVGSFRSNPWGFADMLGNALQWVSDCPDIGYGTPPAPPDSLSVPCEMKGLRGASWASIPVAVRSASRNASKPSVRNSTFGFRVAAD